MFETILKITLARLEKLKNKELIKDFVLIGGLAVSSWGFVRATADIDFALSLSTKSLEDIAVELEGVANVGDFGDPLLGTISFIASSEYPSLPIQLIQFPPTYEEIIFHEVKNVQIKSCNVPVVDIKSLILIKLYAGSSLDLEDALQIYRASKLTDEDISYILEKSKKLRLSRKFEKLLTNV